MRKLRPQVKKHNLKKAMKKQGLWTEPRPKAFVRIMRSIQQARNELNNVEIENG